MAATVSSSTPVAAIAFRWLDILEKEFDKSYVGLDHQLAQMLNIREEDCDERVGKVTNSKRHIFEIMKQNSKHLKRNENDFMIFVFVFRKSLTI